MEYRRYRGDKLYFRSDTINNRKKSVYKNIQTF